MLNRFFSFSKKTSKIDSIEQNSYAEPLNVSKEVIAPLAQASQDPQKKRVRILRKSAYIQNMFEASTWVYICVTKWMEAIASVPWVLKKRNESGDWDVIKNSEFEFFLENGPNPYTSGNRFKQRLTSSLFLLVS